jgi:hypothetical protein
MRNRYKVNTVKKRKIGPEMEGYKPELQSVKLTGVNM